MECMVAEPANIANGTKPFIAVNIGVMQCVMQCTDDQRIELTQVARDLKGEAYSMELLKRQASEVVVFFGESQLQVSEACPWYRKVKPASSSQQRLAQAAVK